MSRYEDALRMYTYEDALRLVDNESPASSDDDKKKLARELLRLVAKHEDSPERIWLNDSLWWK